MISYSKLMVRFLVGLASIVVLTGCGPSPYLYKTQLVQVGSNPNGYSLYQIKEICRLRSERAAREHADDSDPQTRVRCETRGGVAVLSGGRTVDNRKVYCTEEEVEKSVEALLLEALFSSSRSEDVYKECLLENGYEERTYRYANPNYISPSVATSPTSSHRSGGSDGKANSGSVYSSFDALEQDMLLHVADCDWAKESPFWGGCINNIEKRFKRLCVSADCKAKVAAIASDVANETENTGRAPQQ